MAIQTSAISNKGKEEIGPCVSPQTGSIKFSPHIPMPIFDFKLVISMATTSGSRLRVAMACFLNLNLTSMI